MNHAALMYQLNTETAWRLCGKQCEFQTTGSRHLDVTFNINDKDVTDNSGAYRVVVDYKK